MRRQTGQTNSLAAGGDSQYRLSAVRLTPRISYRNTIRLAAYLPFQPLHSQKLQMYHFDKLSVPLCYGSPALKSHS